VRGGGIKGCGEKPKERGRSIIPIAKTEVAWKMDEKTANVRSGLQGKGKKGRDVNEDLFTQQKGIKPNYIGPKTQQQKIMRGTRDVCVRKRRQREVGTQKGRRSYARTEASDLGGEMGGGRKAP